MAPVFIRSLALVAVRCRYRAGSDPVGEFSYLRIGTGPTILCKVSGESKGYGSANLEWEDPGFAIDQVPAGLGHQFTAASILRKSRES